MRIRALVESDLAALREFTDREIGAGYYSAAELRKMSLRGHKKNGRMFSLVLEDNGAIKGVASLIRPVIGNRARDAACNLRDGRFPRRAAYFRWIFTF